MDLKIIHELEKDTFHKRLRRALFRMNIYLQCNKKMMERVIIEEPAPAVCGFP